MLGNRTSRPPWWNVNGKAPNALRHCWLPLLLRRSGALRCLTLVARSSWPRVTASI